MKLPAVIVLLLACQGLAPASDLKVEKAWVFAVPPVSRETAAFMIFTNTGKEPVRIVSAQSTAAGRVAPMITTKTDGRMGMKDVPYLEIPAVGRLVLEPGGDHLMLYDLKAPLKAGQQISITLELKSGSPITVEAAVLRQAPK